MVMAILAFAMAITKMNSDYLSANVSLSDSFSGFQEPDDGDEAYYALFNYEDKFDPKDDEYKTYSSDQLDDMGAAFRAARIFACMGMALIGIPAFVLLAVPCVEYKQYVVNGCGALLLLGSICEVLTFVFYGSKLCQDYDCSFEIGSLPAMASTVLAIITGVITLKIQTPRESQPPPEEMPSEAAPGTTEPKKMSDADENA